MATKVPLPLLRQSERATFKRCHWKWFQMHCNPILGGEGIRPKVEKYKNTADFGTIFHVALAEYYLPGTVRGPEPAETWERLAKDVLTTVKSTEIRDDELVATWEEFYPLGLALCEAYVERYQGDPHWDIIDAERRFDVSIPDIRIKPLKSEQGRRGYTPIVKLVGTFDLCFRDLNTADAKGRPYIKALDHKTVGRIETNHLVLDEQASTYIAVASHVLREQGLIEPDQVVKGMEYNFIKRAKLDDRMRDDKGMARNNPVKRHYGEAIGHLLDKPVEKYKMDELAGIAARHGITVYGDVSKDQSGDNFMRYFVPRTPKERQRQIIRISEEARVMNMVRTGEIPPLKTPTKDCPYCEFFDLCELDESGGDTEYFIQTTMKAYDPYADHREGATNSKKVTDASGPTEG
ncbi:Cas4 family exonuclease [Mycobacterium phage Aikoy]|uniref:Cas4 family exonuclease n=1 Tax=Mycobacterium phage Onyinye TaxID=2686235 RepID=A0A6B9LD31_9CAUD|nr:exonuclease [Mycobacterium phage Onyinye]QHB37478.1 Cas4 family exonuclease [Mycobacterium phage Onyinye]WKW85236.1 Cas4 family exonuclease [Mycobacterium phage Aikoy]